ncbi:hypothetical protein BB558_005517 [Smittium angustum]|uniref:Uncharacterized protein n=1 Tax=Smittium angustum TaxID=133377 RepID=A0A2U1J0A4_SMIAN|nr:hypothetical protein BB558_005517 [Smittium angustum]
MSQTFALSMINQTQGEKQKEWIKLFKQMVKGTIDIGSNKPFEKYASWLTLKVMYGGFATKNLLAGGELEKHEIDLTEHLKLKKEAKDVRIFLNNFFVLEQIGISALETMLENKKYRINVPEEGALLVYTWLMKNNHQKIAEKLLETIRVHFNKVRFYPQPAETPFNSKVIFLSSVEQVIQKLSSTISSKREREKLLYQRYKKRTEITNTVVELWLETFDNPSDIPTVEYINGKNVTVGDSWPCCKYPLDWDQRAQNALLEYKEHIDLYTRKKKGYQNFLFEILELASKDKTALTGRNVCFIRSYIASIKNKKGLPGSEKRKQFMETKAKEFETFLSRDPEILKEHSIKMLENHNNEMGLSNEQYETISNELKQSFSNHPYLEKILVILSKLKELTFDELFDPKYLCSLENLASEIPKLMIPMRASVVTDPSLNYLFEQLLYSFSKRRSYLLLNYESQIKTKDIPWIKPIMQFSTGDCKDEAFEFCRKVLKNVVFNFPSTLLPNKFISQIQPLINMAGLKDSVVFSEELAADIFMGSFTKKYAVGFESNINYTRRTIYDKYYELDSDKLISELRAINLSSENSKDSKFDERTEYFTSMCYHRADIFSNISTQANHLVSNGMIIEQSQILTSHNLSLIFGELEVDEMLRQNINDVISRCLKGVMRSIKVSLIMKKSRSNNKNVRYASIMSYYKQTAFSFRNLVFYISVKQKLGDSLDDIIDLISSVLGNKNMDLEGYKGYFDDLLGVMKGNERQGQMFLGWKSGGL